MKEFRNPELLKEFDSAGRAALHFAAMDGHKDIVKSLLAQQMSEDAINKATGMGYTALHFAVEKC